MMMEARMKKFFQFSSEATCETPLQYGEEEGNTVVSSRYIEPAGSARTIICFFFVASFVMYSNSNSN